MDQVPESRFEARDQSSSDSIRKFEPTLSCILPWQGPAQTLRRHVLPLLDDVSALVQRWELIVVDDGCSNADADAMGAWTQVEGVRIVRLTRRFGRDAAIAAGLQVAHGDLVVVLQGDDPRASELVAGLLVKWRQGFDVVHSAEVQEARSIATRFQRRLRAPSARFASMRTAHRALLIDHDALQVFQAQHDGSFPNSTRHRAEGLRVIEVRSPPWPVGELQARRWLVPSVRRSLGALHELGISLSRWLREPSTHPRFEIRAEIGLGLPPPPGIQHSPGGGPTGSAGPHA